MPSSVRILDADQVSSEDIAKFARVDDIALRAVLLKCNGDLDQFDTVKAGIILTIEQEWRDLSSKLRAEALKIKQQHISDEYQEPLSISHCKPIL